MKNKIVIWIPQLSRSLPDLDSQYLHVQTDTIVQLGEVSII